MEAVTSPKRKPTLGFRGAARYISAEFHEFAMEVKLGSEFD
jgi:hypothetical protein